jgi:hypothetical protein
MTALHVVAGAVIGLVVALLVAIAIPGPQPWLLLGGLLVGGWLAYWRRRLR